MWHVCLLDSASTKRLAWDVSHSWNSLTRFLDVLMRSLGFPIVRFALFLRIPFLGASSEWEASKSLLLSSCVGVSYWVPGGGLLSSSYTTKRKAYSNTHIETLHWCTYICTCTPVLSSVMDFNNCWRVHNSIPNKKIEHHLIYLLLKVFIWEIYCLHLDSLPLPRRYFG